MGFEPMKSIIELNATKVGSEVPKAAGETVIA